MENHFLTIQVLISLAVLLFICFNEKMRSENAVLFILGSLVMSMLVHSTILFSISRDPIISGPMAILLGSGFAFHIIRDKKGILASHEGAILLSFFTFLYVIASSRRELLLYLLIPVIPFFFLLLKEHFSKNPISDRMKIILALYYHFISAIICLHQISFFDDLHQERILDASYIIQSFFLQLTAFWSFYHLTVFWGFLPGNTLKKGKYMTMLRRDVFPHLLASIDHENIPARQLIIALLIHLIPILINLNFQLIPHRMMVSYLVLISPLVVAKTIRK